jgi:hypothetical protein
MKLELSRIANVQLLKRKAIISLISNVKQSSAVLEKVLRTNLFLLRLTSVLRTKRCWMRACHDIFETWL